MSTHLRKDYARQLINAEEKKSLKILFLKLKSDYRSKFANLGNWKEEAWKNQGFNGIRTRYLSSTNTGAMFYQLTYAKSFAYVNNMPWWLVNYGYKKRSVLGPTPCTLLLAAV